MNQYKKFEAAMHADCIINTMTTCISDPGLSSPNMQTFYLNALELFSGQIIRLEKESYRQDIHTDPAHLITDKEDRIIYRCAAAISDIVRLIKEDGRKFQGPDKSMEAQMICLLAERMLLILENVPKSDPVPYTPSSHWKN